MKRLLALAILLAAASSIAIVRSANKSADTTQDAIIAQEKQILEALKKKDSKSFHTLVASDAILVSSQGRLPIADFEKFVFAPDYTFVSATVDDPQVKMIDGDSALLTYKTTGTETFKDQTHTGTAYVTTLYAKRGGKWVGVFHQESMVNAEGGGQ